MRFPFFLLLVAAAPAFAQAQRSPFEESVLRAAVDKHMAAQAAQLTRYEVQVGPFTPRADLPACARTDTFLPTGARPWGRMAVGVRCVEGGTWTVMVPVTVRAWTTALVAAAPLAAGAVPSAQDLQEQEIELTRETALPLRDAQAVQGRALTRPLAAGQLLRADMLRAVQVVNAGDAVRLRIAGAGFNVSAAGQALTAAAEGQPVRVRTELGRVLSGTAREGRIVDVAL
ncbi:flagellar basal body P-ring formation chaperone FlgA [Ramlibacter humi]|uniref:Flagella basal body P-ring formation protein FlgA n=1 Tax=Ramlibacter humi TaxID=2530451 RepID=A0A4Z0CBU7_9BURK|nr:flagellar basal body P-ring formation chaperone FlgA [Ramlibacter humi]TFZ08372.1 flagellar basal body P-ring formation protein FlgA [Ramlibacter humi]